MWNFILAYLGTSGSLFLNKNGGKQEKKSIIRVRVG